MSKVLSITKGTGGGGGGTITLTGDVTGSGTSSIATTAKTDLALAGNPTTTTQAALNGSTRIATTAYADAHARAQVRNIGIGIVSENGPLIGFTAAVAASTTRVYAQLVPFLAGDVLTNMVAQTRTAGVGTTPTSVIMGIADKTGAVKAVTANFAASADLTTGNHITVQALSSPYTILTSDVYYLFFYALGTWGTTQMTLAVQSATAGIVGGPVGSGLPSTATTTSAGAPTTATTFTLVSPANTSAFWMAAS